MGTYLLITLTILAIPLIFSFTKKVHFISNLKYVLISIFINALVFIPWDMGFTAMKIWEFNDKYTLGMYIGNLPLEQYLYYITIPYLYLFIYEYLKTYMKKDILRRIHFSITPLIIIGLVFLLTQNIERTLTAASCAVLILFLLIQLINGRRYMGWFYLTYFISLIPFLIINGLMTGLPVLIYNNAARLNLTPGTIPIDNFIYNAALLLLVIMGYEWSKRKFSGKKIETEGDKKS